MQMYPDVWQEYQQIIDQPMDLRTIRLRLFSGSYQNINDFNSDCKLVLINAIEYNDEDTRIHKSAVMALSWLHGEIHNRKGKYSFFGMGTKACPKDYIDGGVPVPVPRYLCGRAVPRYR